MRLAGLISTAAVVLFWVTMNGLLLRRTLEYRDLDRYRQGMIDFLGGKPRRERAMGVYKKVEAGPHPGGLTRIGRTRFALERAPGGGEGYAMEFSARVDIDLFDRGSLRLEGHADLDARLVPEKLSVSLALGSLPVHIDGRSEGKSLLVTVKGGQKDLLRFKLPRTELLFTDGLVPSPSLGGLRPGDSYRVPVLDPLFPGLTGSEFAQTRVEGMELRQVDGISVECLVLETTFRGMLIRSWVTADGDVLRQEVPSPFNVILLREDPAAAAEGGR